MWAGRYESRPAFVFSPFLPRWEDAMVSHSDDQRRSELRPLAAKHSTSPPAPGELTSSADEDGASSPTPLVTPGAGSSDASSLTPPMASFRQDEAQFGPALSGERETIIDVVRGVTLLAILLVNVMVMRGSDVWVLLAGELPESSGGIDRVVNAAVSWLAAGKFLSSFAILFGLGAGVIVGRAVATGRSARRLLARRYAWLLPFGLVHMILLFPGDILFVYGVAGLFLLAFVNVRPSTALRWSLGLLAAFTAIAMLTSDGGAAELDDAPDDPSAEAFAAFVADGGEHAVEAFTEGSYAEIIVANGWQSVFIQIGQLLGLPFLLGLFLLGFAIARAGIATHLVEHRPLLRRAAFVGLGVGLPLNALLAMIDPATLIIGGTGQLVSTTTLLALTFVRQVGVPLLAIGYLAALALLCLRVGPSHRLAAVGRVSLSAYLLQSLLALLVFAGFRLYDQLGTTASMLVVLGIWAALLVVCPWWLARFRFGPAEWLWRSLTYGARQPMLRAKGRQDVAG